MPSKAGERAALGSGACPGPGGQGQDDLDRDACNGMVGAHRPLNRQRPPG